VIGRGGVSAPGGNRDTADGQEGGKKGSTRRDRLVRRRGGAPRLKGKKVRRTRGRIGEHGKCRSRVVRAGNKSVDVKKKWK
jgi:hypothetical protein